MSTNHSSLWFLRGQKAIVLVTGSYSKSPTRMLNDENYFNRSDFFTSPFSMTMPVMVTGTTFVEEQLVEMAHTIAKLTKTVEEKDMQIVSLINKVEAQV